MVENSDQNHDIHDMREKMDKSEITSESELKKESVKKKKLSIDSKEYEELREKAKLRDEYFDRLLRLQAEFENFKKRSVKEREDFIKYANESLIRELVNIADNFERAFDSAKKNKDFKLLQQGVELTWKQLSEFLEKNGVNKIESVGGQFDPAKHEAVEYTFSDEHPENVVVEEIQKGYSLNNKVIRPAIVRVTKKTEARGQTKENIGQTTEDGSQTTEDGE